MQKFNKAHPIVMFLSVEIKYILAWKSDLNIFLRCYSDGFVPLWLFPISMSWIKEVKRLRHLLIRERYHLVIDNIIFILLFIFYFPKNCIFSAQVNYIFCIKICSK
uniref:Uncharacterized protein n=1 Tax=Onchocerca volvulus TaxID=6282 RepID=A0A8R1TPE3_ONCVO